MEQTTKGSAAARRAIYWLTTGSLLLVWGGVWWVYMDRHPPAHDVSWYLCYGCLLSGLALAVIGLITGHIGRAARQADLPPTVSATPAPGQIQPVPGQTPGTMAPMPGPVVPGAGMAPGMMPAAPPQQAPMPQQPATSAGGGPDRPVY